MMTRATCSAAVTPAALTFGMDVLINLHEVVLFGATPTFVVGTRIYRFPGGAMRPVVGKAQAQIFFGFEQDTNPFGSASPFHSQYEKGGLSPSFINIAREQAYTCRKEHCICSTMQRRFLLWYVSWGLRCRQRHQSR